MLERVDHVIVVVRDLERATDTYGRLLGRRPSWRGEHPELGTANVLFGLENTALELLTPAGKSTVATTLREHLERRGEGPFAIAFGVADADAAAEALRKAGLDPVGPVEGEGVAGDERRRWRNVFLPREKTRGVFLFAIERMSPGSVPGAPVVGAPEAAVTAMDHVVIFTDDPDRARSLYGDRLGIRLALDRTSEEWGVRLLFFRLGGLTVEVAARLGEERDRSRDDRLWGISWRVSDVEAARRRLVGEGFDVSEVRPGRKPGTRVATVRGEPHGVATLILGPDSERE